MRGTLPTRTAWLHAALLVLAVAAVYGRTLAVPFYLDDFSSIRENDLLYHWQGVGALWRWQPMRIVAYLSLALNFRLGGFAPAGYHLFNTAVHALAALALYALAAGSLRTPRVRATMPAAAAEWLPLAAALLFAVHPLHTQAVTYVVQRLASMAALFYIGSLACYVRARLAPGRPGRVAWSAACVLAAGLAFFTKENTATLPLAALLLEAVCFAPGRRRLLGTAAGSAAALALFAFAYWAGRSAGAAAAGPVAALGREVEAIPRGRYFATQLPVVADYLRMFAWPAGLHLDHDVRLRTGLLEPGVLAAGALHVALLGAAAASWRRRPMIAFGLLLHYLAHAIESSVIPIRDLAFEHRAYLPDAGLCLVAAWLLAAELPARRATARLALPLAAALVLALGIAAWRRNETWRDPLAFWRSNVALAPGKARPHGMLGRWLLEAGRPAEALGSLEAATRLRGPGDLDPSGAELDAINTMWALRALGRHDEALAVAARFADRPMPASIRAGFDVNIGNVYFDQGRFAEAEGAFRRALVAWPDCLPALANLASACAQSGRYAEAEGLLARVLELDPADRVSRVNLLQVRAQEALVRAAAAQAAGEPAKAAEGCRTALAALEEAGRIDPANADLARYAGVVREQLHALERAPGAAR